MSRRSPVCCLRLDGAGTQLPYYRILPARVGKQEQLGHRLVAKMQDTPTCVWSDHELSTYALESLFSLQMHVVHRHRASFPREPCLRHGLGEGPHEDQQDVGQDAARGDQVLPQVRQHQAWMHAVRRHLAALQPAPLMADIIADITAGLDLQET